MNFIVCGYNDLIVPGNSLAGVIITNVSIDYLDKGQKPSLRI